MAASAKEEKPVPAFEPVAAMDARKEVAAVVPQAFEPPAFAPASTSPVREKPAEDFPSDSHSIRQLEICAIFGLDREIDADELLERCRMLPRVVNVARIRAEDVVTIEALKNLLADLGFGTGALKLQIGSAPLDFIREGKVILAVQTEGGFAPGVRETLILAAREMGRMP